MKWVIKEDVYIYDGTIEGLFTIAYKCLQLKTIPTKLVSIDKYQDNLLEIPIFIKTNLQKSEIIFKKISQISDFTLYTVFTCFLSDQNDKDLKILKYLISAFKYGSKINNMRNKEVVIEMRLLHRQVKGESHRLQGFLRFTELNNHVLYAKMEPDNNVIEFLANHFAKRLQKENWIIHDLKRNIVAVYDTNKIVYGKDSTLDLDMIKKLKSKDEYEKLWKQYFKNIGIKERKNRRCQLNFMPKKYWKHMLEVENQE